jgi:transglutaminase-like putative cysteine protease
MDRPRRFRLLYLLLAIAIGLGCNVQSETIYDEEYYYAIEIKDRLCGYSRVGLVDTEVDGRPIKLLEHRVFMLLTLLGSDINTEVTSTSHHDFDTGEVFYSHSQATQGPVEASWTFHLEDGQARVVSSLSEEEKLVPIPPEGLIEGALDFPHLKEAFVTGDLESKSWEIFDVRDAAFQKTTYTKVGNETVELAGETFETVVLDRLNHINGVKMRFWIETDTMNLIQLDIPGDRRVYLSGPSVVKRIELANLDESILSTAGAEIADMHGITYMKVRLVAEPTGTWITPEDLNVSGQTFEGTVVENRVEGVFEIRHPRYDGADAPPFPADYSDDEALRPYLEPQDMIQSRDLVLVKKAREITAGSRDSWAAAVRLSQWVADNIDYAIPGGVTARKTYDIRAGECGAHSLLVTAFCRAVGIPARVVWGCMYVPSHGGAFGQHGWNEVYMGDAGWIPLDSTAYEADFVDSGHIRLGEYESAATAINMIETEVLDYEIGDGGRYGGATPAAAFSKYDRYVGAYRSNRGGRKIELIVQNGTLVVDLPDPSPMLPLNDPDAEGVWFCKLSPKVFARFDETAAGEVTGMELHELIRLRRIRSPEEIDDDVPEELRPYLGTYLLAQLNAEFTVLYKRGHLAVKDPFEKKTIRLDPPDAEGKWLDEFGKNTLTFQRDDAGAIETLTIDSVSRFNRS